jgi:hypothetical protein
MKTESSDKWVISICGLNCAKCDIHAAGHGNEKKRNEIIEWFKKERNRTLEPEQVRCEGCRGPLNAHWSDDCKMMLCAKRKEMQYCFQCEDFPCAIVDGFALDGAPHHRRTVENAKRMREIGLDAWIAEQKRKGQCLFCP